MKNLLKSIALTAALTFPSVGFSKGDTEGDEDKQLMCLALNVYHESRAEPLEGQLAVAHVTMNRVNDSNWPNTICKVVYQPHQFEWVKRFKTHTPHESDAWETALAVAKNVYYGLEDDNTNNSVFFHSTSINPSWARKSATVQEMKIGAHIFYSWKGHW